MKCKYLTLLFLLFFSFVVVDSAFAQHDPYNLISTVEYMNAPNCGDHDNPFDATLFNVKFNWGSGCNDDICKTTTKFHCTDPGDKCSNADVVYNSSIEVYYQSSSDGWEEYKVNVPVESAYQTAKGGISRKLLWSGKSTVSASGSSESTGYVRSNENVSLVVSNCSMSSGCAVSFSHAIDAMKHPSSMSSSYTIKRTSNDTSKVANKTTSGNYGGDNASGVYSETVTLYPGMVVCESLSFEYDSTKSSRKTTTACASATGTITGSADIDILVKNDTVDKYNTYQREVYAKPGDALSYKVNYNPVAQSAYDSGLAPQRIQINADSGTSTCEGNGNKLAALFNSCGSGGNWNNAFSVTLNGVRTLGPSGSFTHTYALGDSSSREEEHSDYNEVAAEDVGTVDGREGVTGHGLMNSYGGNMRTPKGITSKMSDDNKNIVIVNVKSEDKEAYVRVPYNFVNRIPEPVTNKENDDIVYGGETDTFSFNIETLPKLNSETMNNGDKDYATIARDAKWKLQIYTENYKAECEQLSEVVNDSMECADTDPNGESGKILSASGTIGDLNPRGNMDGDVDQLKKITINIPDFAAGTRICVRAGVYPATSGADTNWNNKDGDGQWSWSEEKCYKVAKKPSIQVWGGNVYSAGNITTSISTKNNVKNHTLNNPSYAPESSEDPRTFGSWGELGVVSNGEVRQFGSGASMGYAANSKDISWVFPNPYGVIQDIAGGVTNYGVGGSNSSDFCKNSPLTFGNGDCDDKVAGLIGNNTNTNKSEIDKQTIISMLAAGTTDSDNYDYEDGNIVMSEPINGQSEGIKKIKHAKDNIIIRENIIMDRENTTYSQFSEIPRVVLYAEGDIYIYCNVDRVDAILIADGTVKTCVIDDNGNEPAEEDDGYFRDKRRDKQLVINGTIIADKLNAGRTYGASSGVYSMISSELVNFDSTLYQFGGNAVDDEDSTGRLEVTYIYELAPRL